MTNPIMALDNIPEDAQKYVPVKIIEEEAARPFPRAVR